MPMYSYINDDTGEMVEVFHHMKDAPPSGHAITRGGRQFRKVVDGVQVSAGVATVVHKFPYESISSCVNAPGAGAYRKDGTPIITSQRNRREFLARNRDDGMVLKT